MSWGEVPTRALKGGLPGLPVGTSWATTGSMPRRYWLLKSEPESFAIADLAAAPRQTTSWDGVRNYQARNFLRDDMKVGDGVLFYHSNADPSAVVGTAKVVREGHLDVTQFVAKHHHYDPDASPARPRWYVVDIKYESTFKKPLSLDSLRVVPGLADMVLLKKGSRLSVQPVTAEEWKIVVKLGGV